jgi:hypothetical protein
MTDLYLIMRLLKDVVPDDISNKILNLLLGIARTPCANCFQSAREEYLLYYIHNISCKYHYEINSTQNKTQEIVMCDIRIAQFDRDCDERRRATLGAIKNIKKYMKILEIQFNQRHKRIFC